MAYNMNIRVRFYLKPSGRSPVEDFLNECSSQIKSDFVDAIQLLASGHHLAMPASRSLSSIYSGLHELRLKDRTGQVRVFYYFKKDDAIYVLHAIRKKTQQLPKHEIDLILDRLKEL